MIFRGVPRPGFGRGGWPRCRSGPAGKKDREPRPRERAAPWGKCLVFGAHSYSRIRPLPSFANCDPLTALQRLLSVTGGS